MVLAASLAALRAALEQAKLPLELPDSKASASSPLSPDSRTQPTSKAAASRLITA